MKLFKKISASEKLKALNLKWREEKPLLSRKEEIRKEREEIVQDKRKTTTTKRLVFFIFATFTAIELFTGYLMLHQMYLAQISVQNGYNIYTPDMAPQIGLISAVVGEVITFAIYALKSLKENSKGGIIYDKLAGEFDSDCSAG